MESSAISVIIAAGTALITLFVNKYFDKAQRKERQENNLVDDLIERVKLLELSVKELNQELKNRDGEYLILYKEHTTLKAKYDILLVDSEKLRKDHTILNEEITHLKARNEKIDTVHKEELSIT